jgi:hypothetical protein
MGFWNDGLSTSRPRSRSRSHSRDRHRSSSSKHYTSKPTYTRSTSSFFGLPNTSTASHHSSSSKRYYSGSSRAQPRRNFTNRLITRLRRFLRDLYYYMRRHPFKVFILVIMPLLTGGALTKILSQFGVRLPRGLENLVGGSGSRGGVGGYQKERYYARGGARDFGSGTSLPGMGGGMGENLQGLLKVAKMFM